MKKLFLLFLVFMAVTSCQPINRVADIPTLVNTPSATKVIFTATSTAVQPVFHPNQIIASDFASSSNSVLHDVILFFSTASQPFPNFPEFGANEVNGTFCFKIEADRCVKIILSDTEPQLWAISPNVQSPKELIFPGAIYLHHDLESERAVVVENETGATYTNEKIFNAKLPEECYGILEPNEYPNMPPSPCSDYKFSADGKYLGFFFGPQVCLRGIIILDVQTGEKLYRSDAGMGHWFAFFPNNKVLVATGSCEGGYVHLFDPITRDLTDLGGEGEPNWSPNQKIVMMKTGGYQGSMNHIWSYNADKDLYFEAEYGISENETWASDGNHYLYQNWETLSYDKTLYKYMIGASRIILVDAVSGTSQVMLSDPQYDYQFCDYWHVGCVYGWRGDWIQVIRSPTFEKEYNEFDSFVACIDKDKCKDASFFSFNWITGELIPWDEFLSSTYNLTPTPIPTQVPGPNLSSKPLYIQPDNSYSLYIGNDNQSLWYVPSQGDPIMWVASGYDFTYFP